MKFAKSPRALVDAFDSVMPGPPAIRKLMFGYPAAFVNGNMFAGLFGDQMHLRLGLEERDELISLGGKTFEPMPGRPMREYVVVPASILASHAKLSRWMARALAYGSSLPAKKLAKKLDKKAR